MRTPINSTQDIGRVVRAVRRQSQLRLEDLAATTGLSKQFVTDLENGKLTLRLGLTLKLLAELGVKVTLDIPQAVAAEVASLQAQEKAHPGKSPRLSSRRPGAGARRAPNERVTPSLSDDEAGTEGRHDA
jgi:transcriptional regulator with XRE-family HTH domain